MINASVLNIEYVESDTIRKQGKHSDIEGYLKRGYIVTDERQGNWVLTRNANVIVTLKSDTCVSQFYMKNDILNYYNRERISAKLIDDFEKDVESGKITFEMSNDGMMYTMR